MDSKSANRPMEGTINGFEVWLWYGLAEYGLRTVVPLLLREESVIMVEQWRANVLLLSCYAMIGCLLGLATALLLDRRQHLTPEEFSQRSRAVLVLTVVVAFGLNVVTTPDLPAKAVEILAVTLIAGGVIWSVWRADRYRFLGHPAAVASMLLVSGCLAYGKFGDSPAISGALFTLAATIATMGAAIVAMPQVARFHSRLRSSAWAHALEAGAIFALVLCPGIISSLHAVAGTFLPAKPGSERPNIILITLDTVRADHMGIYGYTRQNTPNLTALLKDSTLYTNFIAASSLTLTSHASMFSGLYPQSHGAFMEGPDHPTGRPFPTGIPTAASILKSAGYRTAAAAANWGYLGPDWRLLRDFDYAWMPRPTPVINRFSSFLLRNRLRKLLPTEGVAQDFDSRFISAEQVNREAFALLDQAGSQKAPFFLFLNYMDAHFPYVPPPPFAELYPGYDPSFPNWYGDEFVVHTNTGEHTPQPREWAHLVSQYDGAIAYEDYELGELVLQLKRTGQYDRTMIVITSDHGESLGERGILGKPNLGHNWSSYQNQVHIPLLIKYPRSAQTGTIEALAGHVDLLPTILDVAGLAEPKNLPGLSLLRLAGAGARSVISERHEGGAQPDRVSYALLSGSSKLIFYSPNARMEFYDLATDPTELHNLYRPDDPSCRALSAALQKWIRLTPRRYLSQAPMDAGELKRLKSLGYVEN